MKNNVSITQQSKRFQIADVSFPAAFDHAERVWFYDVEGNRYMDFSSGYGVSNVGWQHPRMVRRIREQAGKSTYAPPWMPTEEAAMLGEKIAGLCRFPAKVFRSTGGGDANEILLKILYAKNGGEVISYDRSYHGGTQAAIGLGDGERFRLPRVKDTFRTHKVAPAYCLRCPYGKKPDSCSFECVEAVDQLCRQHKTIKTFFAEPVIGSGGVIVPPPGYFKALEDVCRKYGLDLIFDEVLTGCGRTGQMLASDTFDTHVQGFTMAKGLGGGYTAIGAAVAHENLLEAYREFDDVSASFAWNPLSCAVALENLSILEDENIPANAAVQGARLKQQLTEIYRRYLLQYLAEVRGQGLIIGVELKEKNSNEPNPRLAMRLLLSMLKKGLMWCASWDYHTMIALPPLIINDSEMDHALNIIEDSAREISGKL